MVWNHDYDASAAKVVRDIIPSREASEAVAENRAGTPAAELRRRHEDLPVDFAAIGIEHEGV